MHCLRGFDYKRPYFYMVTLKRLSGLVAFPRIVDEAEVPKEVRWRLSCLEENEIAKAFVSSINLI